METVVVKNNHNQSVYSYNNNNNNKQIRIPKKTTRSFNDKIRPSENLSPATSVHGFNAGVFHYPQPYYQYQQNPPLLPLPVLPIPRNNSLPCRTSHMISSYHNPTPTRKTLYNNNARKQSKSRTSSMEETKKELPTLPNPTSVVPYDSSFNFVSPPPSSLPLPRFSLRPEKSKSKSKLSSCNAEAVGVDTGATDNLRRMLRLP